MTLPTVYGIGLGRTGTRSLCAALRGLGWHPVLHVPAELGEALQAQAAVEGVCMCQWRELRQLRPDAKFILTTRPLLGWLDSCRRAVTTYDWRRYFAGTRNFELMVRNRCARYGYFCKSPDDPDFERRLTIHYYQYHAQILSHFGVSDQLLVLNVSLPGAFEQLCAFLGVTANAEDQFPHVTD